jgi:hypothetical protein
MIRNTAIACRSTRSCISLLDVLAIAALQHVEEAADQHDGDEAHDDDRENVGDRRHFDGFPGQSIQRIRR